MSNEWAYVYCCSALVQRKWNIFPRWLGIRGTFIPFLFSIRKFTQHWRTIGGLSLHVGSAKGECHPAYAQHKKNVRHHLFIYWGLSFYGGSVSEERQTPFVHLLRAVILYVGSVSEERQTAFDHLMRVVILRWFSIRGTSDSICSSNEGRHPTLA